MNCAIHGDDAYQVETESRYLATIPGGKEIIIYKAWNMCSTIYGDIEGYISDMYFEGEPEAVEPYLYYFGQDGRYDDKSTSFHIKNVQILCSSLISRDNIPFDRVLDCDGKYGSITKRAIRCIFRYYVNGIPEGVDVDNYNSQTRWRLWQIYEEQYTSQGVFLFGEDYDGVPQ